MVMKLKDVKKAKGICDVHCYMFITEEKSSTGKNYISITLNDGDEIKIPIWSDDVLYEKYKKKIGEYLIDGKVEYVMKKGKYDVYKLYEYTELTKPNLMTCVNIEELKKELKRIIAKEVEDEELKNLLFKFCKDKEILEQLFKAPASENSSYSHEGGLLAHIVRLCLSSIAIANTYNNFNFSLDSSDERINKSLLITGAILHNVGKIRTLEVINDSFTGLVKVQKTFEGELSNDLTVSLEIVNKLFEGSDVSEEKQIIIKHMISSVKGQLGYGALAIPRTKEANILSMLDRIDAMVGNFEFMKRSTASVSDFTKLFDKTYCLTEYSDY